MLCPKCGRSVSSEITVSPSEVARSGGLKNIRCVCGYTFTYKTAGYDERRENEIRAQRAKNTALFELSRPYKRLCTITYILSILSVAFYMACNLTNAKNDLGMIPKILVGLALIIVSCLFAGLFLFIPFFLTRSMLLYPKNENSGVKSANIALCLARRILGFAVLVGAVAVFGCMGLRAINVIG